MWLYVARMQNRHVHISAIRYFLLGFLNHLFPVFRSGSDLWNYVRMFSRMVNPDYYTHGYMV